MLQNKGRVYYENNYYNNFNNGGMRHDNSITNFNQTLEEEKINVYFERLYRANSDVSTLQGKEEKMEQPEVVTMITSVIAGLYAVVKTIINLIKKFKN